MSRIVPFAALVLVVLSGPGRAAPVPVDPEDKAVTLVRELGGRITRDDRAPEKPAGREGESAREDESRTRDLNAGANLALLRRVAVSLLKRVVVKEHTRPSAHGGVG